MDTNTATPRKEWEKNNESFNYEPPEEPPEYWSPDEFTELWDRMIGRQVKWTCSKCSQPFGSVEKARRHVQNRHGDQLLKQFTPVEAMDS
ncbi:hypothetical protein [Haloprofundus halobius]|uniref:hypothetical protein n=1 Tax=Haloprofundus halobius TaxID=2876194 RepID=UPI001CCA287A|nr:hypothetical protein [Haloprofundus halobius]